jgi:hypothetical protein
MEQACTGLLTIQDHTIIMKVLLQEPIVIGTRAFHEPLCSRSSPSLLSPCRNNHERGRDGEPICDRLCANEDRHYTFDNTVLNIYKQTIFKVARSSSAIVSEWSEDTVSIAEGG